jgi:DNA-binding IclR family transcriptional regulator
MVRGKHNAALPSIADRLGAGEALVEAPETEQGSDRGIAAGERGIEQTFGRAAALFDALAGAHLSGLRFTDLMNQTGFSRATLHRLISGLEAHGFVEVEKPGGRYFLGLQLGAWAAAARNRFGIAERAAPIVQALSERLNDTAYLSVRSGEMAMCLVLQEGAALIRALPLREGDHSALGVGSASAAILAFLGEPAEIDRILACPSHVAYCRRRSVPEEHIRRHIARTRRLGYSFVDDLNPDMTGMGMPIRDAAGRGVAAVSIATIHSRLKAPGRREAVLAELRRAAAELEPLFRSTWPSASARPGKA